MTRTAYKFTPAGVRALDSLKGGAKLHVLDRDRVHRSVTLTLPNGDTQALKWAVYQDLKMAGVLKMTGGGKADGHYVIKDEVTL